MRSSCSIWNRLTIFVSELKMAFLSRRAKLIPAHTWASAKRQVVSQESYGRAIDEFIGWYCSGPRLALNRSVVLRCRFFVEQKNLAPGPAATGLASNDYQGTVTLS